MLKGAGGTVSMLQSDPQKEAPPPRDHRLELPLSPPDGNHAAHWAAHPGSPDDGLVEDGGFNLADIR